MTISWDQPRSSGDLFLYDDEESLCVRAILFVSLGASTKPVIAVFVMVDGEVSILERRHNDIWMPDEVVRAESQ
jgi:hypothetical protein